MTYLTKRRLSAEHMDDPGADREELARALAFLRTVNRRLGGTAAALAVLKKWTRGRPRDQTVRVLDIGTGSADIPRAIADWAVRNQMRVHITAVDRHPVTVDLARKYIGPRDDITIVQADALRLMDTFQHGEFDVAHAGLFLHHLPDIEVLTVLRIMDRLTARPGGGVIWNDLIRGTIGRLGVRLLTMGSRVPAMVRHDGIVSVEAGFTPREAMELARRAGLEHRRFRRHWFHRFTLTSRKD